MADHRTDIGANVLARALPAALLLLAPACWDEGRAPRDAGVDAHPEARVDGRADGGPLPLNLPKGGPGHSDVSATLGAGQVRAGRVTQQGQLLTGLKVMGRIGDYKIYNNKVAFIIEDARASDGFAPYGGGIADAARLGQAGPKGQSFLGELMLGIGERMQQATSVGVVQDGSDGQPALIRAIGEPAVFPLIAAMLGGEISFPPEVYLVVDYVLASGSDALEIRYRVVNKLTTEQSIPLVETGVMSGDGVEFFIEDLGFSVEGAKAQSYVSMIGPPLSYTLISLDKPLTPLVEQSGIWVLTLEPLTVPAAGEVQRRLVLALADGEPEAVRRVVRKVLKQADPAASLAGKVLDAEQAPVAEARIHVQTAETPARYVTMTRSGAGGAYSLALAPGKYALTVIADGRATLAPTSIDLPAGPTTRDLAAGGSATVSYSVKDDKGTPLPAKLVFNAKIAPTAPPASFGERSYSWGVPLLVFSATGSGAASLAPGEYLVSASRGFEYETDSATLYLADGDKQAASFTLVRSVDTAGYMCGDFHLHAMWSPDSSDLYEMKVAALAAEGLEIPVITEHEYIGDLNPTIAALGLQGWMRGFSGEELTTVTYGHFNPYPLKQDPGKRNNGAMPWLGKTAPQVFSDVRAAWPDAVLQVNHPRSSGIGGYLTAVGYDPKTGTAKSAANWSRNYDALEVFNGAGWNSYFTSTVQDWFSFLDRGQLVTATGNSDSHHAYWSEVGYPRNCLKLSTDDPTKLDAAELARAVKDQHTVVCGGAFVTASVGGKGPGEVADAKAKKVSVAIKVQAPTWVPIDLLRVYVGGAEKHKITLDKTTADPLNPVVRFNQAVEVLADSDTYVVAVATGAGSLYPSTSSKEPFGVTNPIYLDVNGNGVYDPPKSF
jgi:hypothetical protein